MNSITIFPQYEKHLSQSTAHYFNHEIEDQFSFTVEEWNANSKLIMTELNQCFSDTKLVVRSSALTEDGFSSSNAGSHPSILHIYSANFYKLSKSLIKV